MKIVWEAEVWITMRFKRFTFWQTSRWCWVLWRIQVRIKK